MICIVNGKMLNDLTQFPPLYFKKDINKQKEEIDKMYNKAQIGDFIFTFDKKSKISKFIRKVDMGMWSHVGIVNKDKKIQEMTISGLVISEFSNLCRPFLDVALYRLKDIKLDLQQQEKLQDSLNEQIKRQPQFNWPGIFFVFLHKRFNIPIKHGKTPADLIYTNAFELISYA